METSAQPFLPSRLNLASLRRAAQVCEGCELYRNAAQTVFGVGPRHALVVMVGEMPGDQEDTAGEPFVGPAGRLLEKALIEAELSRREVYLTNAVKHFRWEPRGKRRLHKSPAARHLEACRPWLQAELLVIKPKVIVCLGAVAAKSLLGNAFRLTKQRGELLDHHGTTMLATHHPAGVLRAPHHEDRERKRQELIDDLRVVATRLR